MKKIISLLGAASLIATGGISVVACQTNQGEKDPFYQLPATRPANIDGAKDIIAYYWDLHEFYNYEYWEKDYKKGIDFLDSENWQKMEISQFATVSICAYIYMYLDYKEIVEIEETSNGNKFSSVVPVDTEVFQNRYNISINPILGEITQKTKEWITNWYNWVLVEENN